MAQATYTVREIGAAEAREIVVKYHYSKKVVSSELHLGVFRDGLLVGCLQYGRPLNGTKTSEKILPGVKMFELNRMVMADSEPPSYRRLP